ncbi:antibiotic biosynthesis monooxygenase [Sphingomonas naphthae]|uniref:Antibiotic biosynthesis monooxygenase n=1 Tax=Sphingomonas naphthae TaxID=1813468 RepID=A0ABY7TRA9_9SPHN|nr:antibiotic biosynthesis monooxygenase family protein [Sphingomonas naphthae]WCT75177.1 antibiotic biosynthesis monooxygenase [Sphingomonas naphthae]
MAKLMERSELVVKDGQAEAFEQAVRGRGVEILASVAGVGAIDFGRGVENPRKFILLVEWADMDAHGAYKETPPAGELRALMGPFVESAAMEHFLIG